MDSDQATAPIVDAREVEASVPAPVEADVQHQVAQPELVPVETAGE